MIPRIDTRMYTNMVLTAIALLLFAGAAKEFGVGFTDAAHAQRQRTVPDVARTDTGVLVDTNIPQTQDVAVAAATSEVAVANREIAAAILRLAEAVREGTGEIGRAVGRSAGAGTTAAGGATVPATASERPTIEVGP